MILPLLLVVLFLGALLAGLALEEAQSTAGLSELHQEQLTCSCEGVSVVNRGEAWILGQMEKDGVLPRWLNGKPFEDGLPGDGVLGGRGNLLLYREESAQGPLSCTLEIYDLDYRTADPLMGDPSLPPSYFDFYSLHGGTEFSDGPALDRLSAIGDVSLSDGASLQAENGACLLSGNGQAFLVFGEDVQGNSLAGSNGEVIVRFRLTGSPGNLPAGFEIGFRLAPAGHDPENAFRSGFSAAFSVEDDSRPENRDRLLLKQNAVEPDGSDRILACMPFPSCRSSNPFDQERYAAYLAGPHELRIRFEPEGVTVVLDPGEASLEKRLSVSVGAVSDPSKKPLFAGLRFRGGSGGGLTLLSLRVHPADEQGYFPECRKTGFYLIRAEASGPRFRQVYETIVSADPGSKQVERLSWTALPFF